MSCWDRQYKMLDMASRQELFTKHTEPLILSFGDEYNTWNVHSVDRLVFDTLLMEAGTKFKTFQHSLTLSYQPCHTKRALSIAVM